MPLCQQVDDTGVFDKSSINIFDTDEMLLFSHHISSVTSYNE